MNNPYEVLGISRNATDEQVKNAYRELARKYHPDNYADNPLSDLASEKMKLTTPMMQLWQSAVQVHRAKTVVRVATVRHSRHFPRCVHL